MGNYDELKQAVSDVIKTNGNQEITGQIMQNTLLSIINTVGENATFAGIATPETNPGTPDQNVFWIASINGLYSNFNGYELEKNVVIFFNKNGNWEIQNIGIPSIDYIDSIDSKVGYLFSDIILLNYNYQQNGDIAYHEGWACLKKIKIKSEFYSNASLGVGIYARCFNSDGVVINTIQINFGYNSVPVGTDSLGVYWKGISTHSLDYTKFFIIKKDVISNIIDGLSLKYDSNNIKNELGNSDIFAISQNVLSKEIVERGLYVLDYIIEGYNYQSDGSLSQNDEWNCCKKIPITKEFYINIDCSVRCFNENNIVIGTVRPISNKVSVVDGTKYVGIYWKKDVVTNGYADKYIIYDGVINEIIKKQSLIGKKYVRKIGDELYVSCKLSVNNDIVYHFKKCMANNLYTFYEVYLSKNDNEVVSTTLQNDGTLNISTSDNIGPILVNSATSSGSLFVGGNHTNLHQGNVVNTAETIAYNIYIDGSRIIGDLDSYVDNVRVDVVNNIYDPLYPKFTDDDKMYYDTILCVENVIYNIGCNGIFVSLVHNYSEENKEVLRYYGMQSMFKDELGVFTPCGKWNDGFTNNYGNITADGYLFNKGEYPNFTTIMQKSQIGYEIDYLLPKLAGNHDYILDSDFICRRSSDKMYHHLIEQRQINGKILSWNGCYIWYDNPNVEDMKDNSNYISFYTDCGIHKYLFISAKVDLDNELVGIPAKCVSRKFNIVKNVGFNNIDDITNILSLTGVKGSELIIEIE